MLIIKSLDKLCLNWKAHRRQNLVKEEVLIREGRAGVTKRKMDNNGTVEFVWGWENGVEKNRKRDS